MSGVVSEYDGLDVIRDGMFGLLAKQLQLPEQSVDGDCPVWTPRVVEVMRAAGFQVKQTFVVGLITGSPATSLPLSIRQPLRMDTRS
jgi:hypothetical protein